MLTQRAILTAVHGMCFGGFALLTVFGFMTCVSMMVSVRRAGNRLPGPVSLVEKIYLSATVFLAWAAVLSGTFLIYPWYRAKPGAGVVDLHAYPRSLLLANIASAPWHNIGMEWKEHVAFLAPVTITAIAFAWWHYREQILRDRWLCAGILAFGLVGLGGTGAAAALGAFLNKLAPVY